MTEKNQKPADRPPHTAEEIRSHIAEGILFSLGAGECIIQRSPIGAVISAIAAVQNFTEAAHKYCDNICWENQSQSLHDRFNDTEYGRYAE